VKYDRKAIDRALRFHEADAAPRDYRYYGHVVEGDHFNVSMRGELFHLKPREAWIVSFALAAARETGKRAANAHKDHV
jgi:hypothetical protein